MRQLKLGQSSFIPHLFVAIALPALYRRVEGFTKAVIVGVIAAGASLFFDVGSSGIGARDLCLESSASNSCSNASSVKN